MRAALSCNVFIDASIFFKSSNFDERLKEKPQDRSVYEKFNVNETRDFNKSSNIPMISWTPPDLVEHLSKKFDIHKDLINEWMETFDGTTEELYDYCAKYKKMNPKTVKFLDGKVAKK